MPSDDNNNFFQEYTVTHTSYGFLTSDTVTCPSGNSLIAIPRGTQAGGSPLGTCPPNPPISLKHKYNHVE